jgi:MFS family permease
MEEARSFRNSRVQTRLPIPPDRRAGGFRFSWTWLTIFLIGCTFSGPPIVEQAPMTPVSAEGNQSARRLVTLLALAIFINYVDRGNLATAVPVIKNELHLSTTQIGILLGAFFWTYMPMQLGAGWLAERFAVHRVVAVGFALWSIATMLTGLVSGFAALLFMRLLLGLGESVAFPCSSKLLAQHVKIDRRGRANGAIAVGLALGPAFGTFVGGLILARFGWRALFISLGALSLLWLWPWLTGPARNLPEAPPMSEGSGPSFLEISRRRAALGAGLGHFCANYTFYFLLSWLPLYLVRERGLSIVHMAALGGAVYLLQGVTAFVTGSTLDRWIQAGATADRAYKTAMVVSQLATAVCLLGVLIAGPVLSAAFLLVCGVTAGLMSPPLYATAQTFAGPTAAGRWMGLQNFLGNIAGVVGPPVTGFLVDRTGNFSSAFALAIAVALVGMLSWVTIVPCIAQLDWAPSVQHDPVRKEA